VRTLWWKMLACSAGSTITPLVAVTLVSSVVAVMAEMMEMRLSL
jgi:hypothetical protein